MTRLAIVVLGEGNECYVTNCRVFFEAVSECKNNKEGLDCKFARVRECETRIKSGTIWGRFAETLGANGNGIRMMQREPSADQLTYKYMALLPSATLLYE